MTDEEKTVRGPYAKTAGVRRGIIEAAWQEFAENGYRATTMKAVAERADISQRGLVHHFKNKEELLSGVLSDYDERIASGFAEGQGLTALHSMIDMTTKEMSKPGVSELYVQMAAEAISPSHPAHSYYQTRYTQFRAYVAGRVIEAIELKEFDSETDPEDLALSFAALLDGLQVQFLYDRSVDVGATLKKFLQGFQPTN